MLVFGGVNCAAVAKQPKLYKATFDLLKAVRDAADPSTVAAIVGEKGASRYVAGAAALASGGNVIAKNSKAGVLVQQGAASTSATLSILKTSLDMAKILRMSSMSGAVVVAGAATMQKVGTGLGLVGSEHEQAKCLGAIMELAGSATVTAATTATLPAISWLTWASLFASGVNAGMVCAPVIERAVD